MSIDNHIAALNDRHSHLEDQIEELAKSPSTDELRVTELKREKLRVKDEIERLTDSPRQGVKK